jgi:hypothetical protein
MLSAPQAPLCWSPGPPPSFQFVLLFTVEANFSAFGYFFLFAFIDYMVYFSYESTKFCDSIDITVRPELFI